MAIYRQGDVLLISADVNPQDATGEVKPVAGRLVLAEGEVTGHSHTIEADRATGLLFGDRMVVVADEPVELTHQEHDTLVIAPGLYFVIRQREYTPAAPRMVTD